MKLKIHEHPKNNIIIIFLLLILALTLSRCNNDDDKPIAEIDKLPPATQTGANTIGCLLDEKAFLPGNYPNDTNCFYQFVDGEFYFSLQMNNINQDNNVILIGVNTNALEITQGNTYALAGNIPAKAYGTYALAGIFTTTDISTYTGELTINKLDEVNHIVSGTFWFDILDFQGNLHQIREGRFDMQYTN